MFGEDLLAHVFLFLSEERENSFCTQSVVNQDCLFKSSSRASLLIMYRQDNLDVERRNTIRNPVRNPPMVNGYHLRVQRSSGFIVLVSRSLPSDNLIPLLFLFSSNRRNSLPGLYWFRD